MSLILFGERGNRKSRFSALFALMSQCSKNALQCSKLL